MRRKREALQTIVYGHGHDGLIFAYELVAYDIAKRLHSIWTSRTWGDFKKAVDDDEFLEICHLYWEAGDAAFEGPDGIERKTPLLDEPFSGPEYFECYPDRALGDPTAINGCLPAPILERFGTSGDAEYMRSWILDFEAEPAIVEELQALGFTVRRDDQLIEGAWDPSAAAAVTARVGR